MATLTAVLDDNTRDADVIGYAKTAEEAASIYMVYARERMSADDFAELDCPTFVYRMTTSVVSPAFEPL